MVFAAAAVSGSGESAMKSGTAYLGGAPARRVMLSSISRLLRRRLLPGGGWRLTWMRRRQRTRVQAEEREALVYAASALVPEYQMDGKVVFSVLPWQRRQLPRDEQGALGGLIEREEAAGTLDLHIRDTPIPLDRELGDRLSRRPAASMSSSAESTAASLSGIQGSRNCPRPDSRRSLRPLWSIRSRRRAHLFRRRRSLPAVRLLASAFGTSPREALSSPAFLRPDAHAPKVASSQASSQRAR